MKAVVSGAFAVLLMSALSPVFAQPAVAVNTATMPSAPPIIDTPNRYGALPLWLRPATNVDDKSVRTQSALRYFSSALNRMDQQQVLSITNQDSNSIPTCEDEAIAPFCK